MLRRPQSSVFISLFFPWHGIIPYREPDRRVRDERIPGSKDLSCSPYPRLGGRYNCSQQNTTPFFITYQANYHQCEGERSAVWCVRWWGGDRRGGDRRSGRGIGGWWGWGDSKACAEMRCSIPKWLSFTLLMVLFFCFCDRLRCESFFSVRHEKVSVLFFHHPLKTFKVLGEKNNAVL